MIPLAERKLLKAMKKGRSLTPYLAQKVGGGAQAMGVYRVQSKKYGDVALKISTESFHLFEEEANILKGLDHPNIKILYEGPLYIGKYVYLIQPYIKGVDGFDLFTTERTPPLPRKRLTRKDSINLLAGRIHVARCVLKALVYLHSNWIVHNDVKLENIIVNTDIYGNISENTEVKLVDFGLACELKFLNCDENRKRGSPEYAAPERFNSSSVLDAKVDVYSFGICLYGIVTGQFPFLVPIENLKFDDNVFAHIRRGQQSTIYRAIEEKKGLMAHEKVRETVLSAMRFNPLKRPTSDALLKSELFKVN